MLRTVLLQSPGGKFEFDVRATIGPFARAPALEVRFPSYRGRPTLLPCHLFPTLDPVSYDLEGRLLDGLVP